MGTKQLTAGSSDCNPDRMVKWLAWLALFAACLIISLSADGIYRSSFSNVLVAAEADALRVSSVMVPQQATALFSGGEEDISLSADEIGAFDTQVRKFLHPFAIVEQRKGGVIVLLVVIGLREPFADA